MPRGSAELTKTRRNEIIDACAKLYKKTSFKDISIKEIGAATSVTRTSIYNYFQTKEEIFLALLQREHEVWNSELLAALESGSPLSREALATLLAETLSRRELMLKILSMNMYDIEENSRLEKLVEFKGAFCASMDSVANCLRTAAPEISEEACTQFLYSFFPFVYGIYPYTTITDKQREAMRLAGIQYHQFSIYDIVLMTVKKFLEI